MERRKNKLLREINLYSSNSKLLNIHPIEKILLVVISLICCSYTKNIYLIFLNIFLLILLNVVAKNPWSIIKKFIYIALIFSISTAITMIWQGQSLEAILLIIFRGINGAITLSFLSLTTPINQIVAYISKYESIRDIADIIKAMERFIILLEEDFYITFKAMKLRGGFRNFKRSLNDYGKAFGLILKNIFRRWKEMSLSLENRCYNGNFNYSFDLKINKKIILGIAIYFFVFIILIYLT